MEQFNVKKSELVNAFTQCVANSIIVCPNHLQWLCPYRNSLGDLVYCVIRLDAGASLYYLPYKSLRCMANLLEGNQSWSYVFYVRYSSLLNKCYLLVDKE